jgi:hypothetical protein
MEVNSSSTRPNLRGQAHQFALRAEPVLLSEAVLTTAIGPEPVRQFGDLLTGG